ncbi:MAG: efflux transporter outer membrane subunit [Flavobacteriales bacterium]
MVLALPSCAPTLNMREANKAVPTGYISSTSDSTNTASVQWRSFFTDPYLIALIDTALGNNQELNIVQQEIEVARNEARARKAEYLPFMGLQAGAGSDKVGRFTRNGAVEENLNIMEDTPFPEPLPDYLLGLHATWEIDIWKKLRNAKKSAYLRYVASVEGKNFLVTNLIAEIASTYYELLALDNQLLIVQQNIEIQSNALAVVRTQKEAAQTTELAVRRFEAEVFHTRSLQYTIQQRITETENRLNFLVGRFPQPVQRATQDFITQVPDTLMAGLPVQLLENRTDVKQAELELLAAKLDVKVARARFYPSIGISAGVGVQAFDPTYLMKTPASLLYSISGDLMAPLINRNAIKAAYFSASALQMQAVYNYERTLLNAYVEVTNQLAMIANLKASYDLKAQQVEALTGSITISNNLFRSARADYMEVLLTQRDALESRFELVATQLERLNATVNTYRALGGGWR